MKKLFLSLIAAIILIGAGIGIYMYTKSESEKAQIAAEAEAERIKREAAAALERKASEARLREIQEEVRNVTSAIDMKKYKGQGKVLLNELISFRHDKKFNEVGFGRCCKYAQWLDRVRTAENAWQSETKKLAVAERISEQYLPVTEAYSWMILVGMRWAKHKGKDDNFSRDSLPKIKKAFAN